MKFNGAFKAANESRHRYRVLIGGAGSGKSQNIAQDFILKLSTGEYRGANLLVVRASDTTHRNSTFAELEKAIHLAGLTRHWEARRLPLELRNKTTGAQIIFRGCKDLNALERLKSVTVPNGWLTWIWVEEANEINSNAFGVLDDRLRGMLPEHLYFQITVTLNPVSENLWAKHELWDSQDPDIFKHHSTYLDNAFVGKEYHRRMQRRLEVGDIEGYNIYALGKWGTLEGQVFRNYSVEEPPTNLRAFSVGLDFGYSHNTAALLLGYDRHAGILYIIDEYCKNEITTADIAKDITRFKQHVIYADAAEPDRIQELSRAGYKIGGAKKKPGSVKAQIDWLQAHKIIISPKCVQTIREFKQYRYKPDTVNGGYFDEPIPIFDDCIAACRYGIQPFRMENEVGTMEREVIGVW